MGSRRNSLHTIDDLREAAQSASSPSLESLGP